MITVLLLKAVIIFLPKDLRTTEVDGAVDDLTPHGTRLPSMTDGPRIGELNIN